MLAKILKLNVNLPIYDPIAIFLIVGFFCLAVLKEQVPITGFVLPANIYIALLGVFSCSFLLLEFLKQKAIWFPKRAGYLLVLFLVWVIVASLFSRDIGESIWETVKFVSFGFLFLATYNLNRKNPKAQIFLMLSFAIVGFLLLARDLLLFFSEPGTRGNYFVGSFYWHNQMAGFLLFLIPILLNFCVRVRQLFFKMGFFLMLVIAVVAMILTYSRGGWLSIIVALPLFSIFAKNRLSYLAVGLSAFILAFLITIFSILPVSIIERTSSIGQDVSGANRTVSGNLRMTVWQNSLKMIKDYPIFGVGPGAFGSVYYKYQSTPWLYAKDAHNYFLQFAAELGLVGLLGFVLFSLSIVLLVISVREKVSDEKGYMLLPGVIVALAASYVHAFVDVDWSRISLFLMFWVFMTVVVSDLANDEKKIVLKGFGRAMILVPVGLVIVSLSLLIGERKYQEAVEAFSQSQIKESEDSLATAFVLNPLDMRLYLLSGDIFWQKGEREQARASYQKATDLSYFSSEPYFKMAQIEIVDKNFQDAQNLLERAVDLAPYGNPNYYSTLADVNLRLQKYDEAKRVIETAVFNAFPLNDSFRGFEYLYARTDFKKNLGWVYWRLANLYIREGKKDEARELLVVLENDLDPTNPLLGLLKSDLEKL